MNTVNSQKGSATLWVVIVAIVVLAVGGYLYYSKTNQTQNTSPASDLTSVSTEQAAQSQTQAPNTTASEQSASNQQPSPQVEANNSASNGYDCGKYVSAEELTKIFGDKNTVNVSVKTHATTGTCSIEWAENQSDLASIGNEDGGINFSFPDSPNQSMMINIFTNKNKSDISNGTCVSVNIGDSSCLGSANGIVDNTYLRFIKNGTMVSLGFDQNMPTSDSLRAGMLTQLAQLIASRIQ